MHVEISALRPADSSTDRAVAGWDPFLQPTLGVTLDAAFVQVHLSRFAAEKNTSLFFLIFHVLPRPD